MAGGIFAFFVVPNDPSSAKFLNAEERIMADARIRRDNAGAKVLIEATKTKLILKAFRNLNVRIANLIVSSFFEETSADTNGYSDFRLRPRLWPFQLVTSRSSPVHSHHQ